MILRGGRMVTEQYWQKWAAGTSQPIHSSSKSITATLIGMAIKEGLLKGVEQSASDIVSGWKGYPREAITIRHMLSMTSGIKVGPATVSADVDAFEETAGLPLVHKPGEYWAYNTTVYRMLLSMIEIVPNESIDRYTNYIFAAFAIPS